ncbi:putative late blight resistance protein homolog R1C-3 [Salvia hispanica]|uniref:putative late blight resistance protein homolog R1C-3 n=1 Tax=Salvia hispanica TaxID=49212 RepID=UPI0020095036|nr:putative late blight resistance protein homolog R1C-3 [Salvia hispanica]
MAAYAAAASIKATILRILRSSRISFIPSTSLILKQAYDEMDTLQRLLLKLNYTWYSHIRTEVNALDERIKEIVWGFEDILESHVVDQILPQLESSGAFFVDLQDLQHNVAIFVKIVKMMEGAYLTEVENMPEIEGEPLSSRIDYSGINSNMVGLSEEFEQIRDYLLTGSEGNCFVITGMPGVGKTMLAKKIFDDPLIRGHFELRAWVKVGRQCASTETLCCILAQVDPNRYKSMLTQGQDDDEKKLVELLRETFKEKKCLIVLDDMWGIRMGHTFPNVQILITSRIVMSDYKMLILRLLDEEESKELLAQKVYGEEGFPPQLNKLGEKIADKCEGLPLLIVKVAEFLSKADKTPKYWTDVVEKQHHEVFEDAFNQIAKVIETDHDETDSSAMALDGSTAPQPVSTRKRRRITRP